MAVPVSGGVALETRAPVRLFRMNTYSAASNYGYDVTPDGQRFLTIVRHGVESLSIVFGWRAELELPPPE